MSKYTIIFAAIAGLVFALAPAAWATPVTIVDHSFEDTQLVSGSSGYDYPPPPDPWAYSGNVIHCNEWYTGLGNPIPTPDGTFQSARVASGELLYQVLAENMAQNWVYTMTVDYATRDSGGSIDLRLGTGGTHGQNLLTPTIVTAPQASAGGLWETWVYTFTAGGGGVGDPLRVEITTGVSTPNGSLVDNVRLDGVPEPATAVLLLLGLPFVMRRRRRS